MHDFDVILKTDWLLQHRTHLDYFERHVLFHPVRESEFSFRGSLSLRRQPVLSFLEARSLIYSACLNFLTCLAFPPTKESSDSRAPYNMHVVSEFVDIFLNEFLSLTSH